MPKQGDISAQSDIEVAGAVPIGGVISYAGGTLPPGVWAWADGTLVNRTVYATLFARVGHNYNGGVDPGSGTPQQGDLTVGSLMRLPDKRGRVSMGADNFGQGAAGRLPNTTNKTRGQSGGTERHQHFSPWPFSENGGGGNFVGYASSVDSSFLTRMGYALRIRFADATTYTQGVIGKLTNAASAAANAGAMSNNNNNYNDIATVYDVAGDLQSTLPNYEADNYIVRIA